MRRSTVATIITIVILLLIAGMAIWWFTAAQSNNTTSTQTNEPAASENSENNENEPAPTDEAPTEGITIVFTNSGFENSTYTVKAGQTVTVKNEASFDVQFSSDDHPTHKENPELNMRTLSPGQQDTFTPENPGTWGIHDHENPQFTTTLVVT